MQCTMYICQVLTGHANTNEHLFRIKLADSPGRQHFRYQEETIEHFLGNCPRFNKLRLDIFGNNTIRSKDFHTLNLKISSNL